MLARVSGGARKGGVSASIKLSALKAVMNGVGLRDRGLNRSVGPHCHFVCLSNVLKTMCDVYVRVYVTCFAAWDEFGSGRLFPPLPCYPLVEHLAPGVRLFFFLGYFFQIELCNCPLKNDVRAADWILGVAPVWT